MSLSDTSRNVAACADRPQMHAARSACICNPSPGLRLVIGCSPELIAHAQEIRQLIFVQEQNIPAHLDLDGLDAISEHALMYDKAMPVATLRLTRVHENHAIMARVAVLQNYRGAGAARALIRGMLDHAHSLGVQTIEIHAHEYLQNYYASFGFAFVQNVEVVGGHQLVEMLLTLPAT